MASLPNDPRPATPDTEDVRPAPAVVDREGAPRYLIGGEGGDFIAATLSRATDVQASMERVRALGALSDRDAEPVLGLLSALGIRRGEAYREMLERATKELIRRVETLPQGTLLSLLDASFPYIGIEELKAVPLAVFAHMSPVPSSYLKQVSRDLVIFRQLPVEVQRQCWALDWQLLRRHASPSMMAYGEETATIEAMINQNIELTPLRADEDWSPREEGAKKKGDVSGTMNRQKIRKESESVQRLMRIIGKTPRLYIEIVRLCRAHFANSGDDAACSLRSQLLMAFHDAGEMEMCSMDKCHRLAWLMDTCIRDRYLDGRRLKEMGTILETAVEKANKMGGRKPPKPQGPTRFRLVGLGVAPKKDGNESDDGGSISRVHDAHEKDEKFEQVPGDMGMILADPPVLHLLLHETVRTLEGVIEAERVPAKERRLDDLTKFICLALTSQACLMEKVNYIPATPKEICVKFFPLLSDLMLSVMLRESDDGIESEEGPTNDMNAEMREKFKALMIWSPCVRKIMLTYALICLQRKNIRTATEVLELAVEVLTDETIAYEGAFATTLAESIAKLFSSKEITTKDAIWKHAVDGLLIRAASTSLEAHSEVLRLLLQASDDLSAESLAHALETTLKNSKASRKRRRKRAKKIVYEYDPIDEKAKTTYGSSHNFAEVELTQPPRDTSTLQPFTANVDGIRAAYQLFAAKGKLNEGNAPVLFDYINKRNKRDGKDVGNTGTIDGETYFDDDGEDGGSLLEFGLSRDVKSPSVIRDSPLMSPR